MSKHYTSFTFRVICILALDFQAEDTDAKAQEAPVDAVQTPPREVPAWPPVGDQPPLVLLEVRYYSDDLN